MNLDIFFMKEALKQAEIAYRKDEVPVGSVIVYQNKIIARSHNSVESLKDATAHAEMICLTMAANYLDDWRLNGTTLYSTLEPCTMCAGAIINARVKEVIWAAPEARIGANGSFINLFDKKHPIHNVMIRQGPLESDSKNLLRKFFKDKRKCLL